MTNSSMELMALITEVFRIQLEVVKLAKHGELISHIKIHIRLRIFREKITVEMQIEAKQFGVSPQIQTQDGNFVIL